eukprot:CAMPEP_0197541908 /NCGR_PEP_ID=MMETSP1318-20131121/67416_1 /TAXON_ID=552666 /ORGANISM="Partenskyella glossopodia, Strain RCC365" /LENGTH=68 /DNA_ID=CAMNT_0043101125 /DNA_START=814 /DNA_END=1020 /DNA_ORIENTATION=+
MAYQLIITLTRYNSARVVVKPVSQQDTQTPTSDDNLVLDAEQTLCKEQPRCTGAGREWRYLARHVFTE